MHDVESRTSIALPSVDDDAWQRAEAFFFLFDVAAAELKPPLCCR